MATLRLRLQQKVRHNQGLRLNEPSVHEDVPLMDQTESFFVYKSVAVWV